MTFAPPTIQRAMKVWTSHGGVNLGIVGDTGHVATGVSYHLGKSQLAPGAYSATLPRDKAGLSEAASACDLGKLSGSLGGLQKFSVWLVAQVRANPQAYRDVREVIYSPDGKVVRRWDNELKALRVGGDGTGQGDNTHLFHTHISFYRDSELREKAPLVAPYFEGEVMEAKPVYETPHVLPLKPGVWLYQFSDLRDDPRNVQLGGRTAEQLRLPHVLTYTPPKDRTVWPWTGGVFMVAYESTTPDANATSRAMFVRSEDLAGKPEEVAAPEPAPPPAAPDVTHKAQLVIDGQVKAEVTV
jgi:hypothetical protein